MRDYQVNFLVKAVVSVDVKADTLEEALKLAKERMNKPIFVKGIDVHNESDEICGYDDNDMWNEVD